MVFLNTLSTAAATTDDTDTGLALFLRTKIIQIKSRELC